jgi:hypothetical protein
MRACACVLTYGLYNSLQKNCVSQRNFNAKQAVFETWHFPQRKNSLALSDEESSTFVVFLEADTVKYVMKKLH